MNSQNPSEWTCAENRTLVTETDLAKRWRKSVRTLQRWRAEDYGPAYIRIGGCICYRIADVVAFEERMRVDPGDRP